MKTATKPNSVFQPPYAAVFCSAEPLHIVAILVLEILLSRLSRNIEHFGGVVHIYNLGVYLELPISSSGSKRYSLKSRDFSSCGNTLNPVAFLFFVSSSPDFEPISKFNTCKSSATTLQSHTRYSPLCAPYTWDLILTTYFEKSFSVDDRFLLEGSALLWPLIWPLMWRK